MYTRLFLLLLSTIDSTLYRMRITYLLLVKQVLFFDTPFFMFLQVQFVLSQIF